jgi:hypothetical protein
VLTLHLAHVSVHVHYFLFIGLAGVVGVDLFLRWFSFGRIESVGLDLSIVTFLYSLAEWVWHDDVKSEWGPKTVVGLFAVLVLTDAHAIAYRTRLRGELLRDLTDRLTDAVKPESRDVVRKLGRLLERAIPLTIELSETDGVRRGKLRIRKESADLINELLPLLGATPDQIDELGISEKSFLLPKRTRVPLYFVFLVVGGVSLVLPAISW